MFPHGVLAPSLYRHMYVLLRQLFAAVVRKANLEMRKKNFTIRAPLDWNNLPQETVPSKTIDEFKWKLDKHWKAIAVDMYELETEIGKTFEMTTRGTA